MELAAFAWVLCGKERWHEEFFQHVQANLPLCSSRGFLDCELFPSIPH